MTGGVSLVSKFKVTNFMPVEDEKLTQDDKLTAGHVDFSINLIGTVQTPHGPLVLASEFLLGNSTVLLE